METDNISILENDFEYVHALCAEIDDSSRRNKAVANAIATIIAAKFFNKERFTIDTESGLHSIPAMIRDFDFSDIYINNYYVDVRVYFSDEELAVPKKQFDAGLIPSLYMFIKLSNDLKNASITGFIRPENINTDKCYDNAYLISKNDLEPINKVENILQNVLDTFEIDKGILFDFIDNSLSFEENIDVLKVLIKSKSARLQLKKALKAKTIFNLISIDSVITNDNSQDAIDVDELNDLFENELVDDYSTTVTPSYIPIDNEEDFSKTNKTSINSTNTVELDDYNNSQKENNETLENLFTENQASVPISTNKKRINPILGIIVLISISVGCYLAFFNNNKEETISDAPVPEISDVDNTSDNKISEKAMPIETVEKTATEINDEQGNAVAIPEIEQNLDASVLITNLKVDWEVPEGYTANTAAKRYLIKLGKIIQLNLKTELLLLTKPPLSNKICIELRFNKNIGKFEVVGIKTSSGEASVDKTILNTVNNALKLNISTSIDSFSKIQGDPVLIIHL